MASAPLITIGITCFNAADTIEKAIDGALAQDWENLEILIVDDASKDNSIEIVEAKTQLDPRVKLVKHPENKGFPGALNTIVSHASGEFIAFFDDDDISAPDRLRKQYGRITAYEKEHGTNLVFCYTNRNVIAAQDSRHLYSFHAIGHQAPEPHGPMVADFILWSSGEKNYVWGMFGSCTLMMRKAAIEKIGGFDEFFRRNTEWDLAVRGAFMGAHFIAANEYLVTQIKTPTSDKAGKIPLQYSLKLREKHKDYLKGKGLYLVARIVARSRFYGGKGKKGKSLFLFAIACLMAPCKMRIIQKAKSLLRPN